LEGEYLGDVAKRRWLVLVSIFTFDVFCYALRFMAKMFGSSGKPGEWDRRESRPEGGLGDLDYPAYLTPLIILSTVHGKVVWVWGWGGIVPHHSAFSIRL